MSITLTDIEFASGQEPSEEGTALLTAYLTFSGAELARLIGRQQRMLDKALKALSPKWAFNKLLDTTIPSVVQTAALRLIGDYFLDELQEEAPEELKFEWAEVQPDFSGAMIKKDSIVFVVELSAWWE